MESSSPEVAWSGKHFQVLRTPVRYPDGSLRTHEQVQAPDVVRVYGVADGCVLLTNEYRADVGRRVIRVPAGRIESGETPEAAAAREFQEEAGYTAGKLELLRTTTPVLKFRHQAWHYLATDISRTGQDLGFGEDIEVVATPLDEIEELVFGEAVPEDSIALTLLMIARRLRR